MGIGERQLNYPPITLSESSFVLVVRSNCRIK